MKKRLIKLIKSFNFLGYEEDYFNRIVDKEIIRKKLMKNNSLSAS